MEPESGSINFQKGIKIGYLPQDYISEVSDEYLFDEVYKANQEIYKLENLERKFLLKNELNLKQKFNQPFSINSTKTLSIKFKDL